MKIACIIVTNSKTQDIYEKNYFMLNKMSIESIYNIDIYTYYNDESIDYNIIDKTIYFSYKTLQEKFNYKYNFLKRNYVGNVFLTLLDLYVNHKEEYDSYIFYEDDVLYTSNENFFDKVLQDNSYDIIFQNKRKNNPYWYWKNSKNKNIPFNTSYMGLLNIYIIKPYVIEDLINFINKGYYAHHECLINQFILNNNYIVKYLDDIMSVYSSVYKINKLDKLYDIIHPIKNSNNYPKIEPFKTCIMSMIKNERRYIKEWIDYHLSIGFDSIFLFEDYRSESHADIVKDYNNVYLEKIENVNIHDYEGHETYTQIMLFKYFLNKLKNEKVYDFCLFIDLDEFLILDNITLQNLCLNYQDYNGIFLSWKMYNANGHIQSPSGNVIDNYTNFTDRTIDAYNNFTQYNKKSFVNINKATKWNTNHIIDKGVDIDLSSNINNKLIYHTAWINHYFTKSFEDFCYRMQQRGNMGNNNRTYDQFFEVNPELAHKRKELIFSQRYNNIINTHYISKEFKLISGGNLKDIEYLNNHK